MSYRTIMIFPEFSNMAVIDSIRDRFDPLAKLVRPHITLVFPFESDMSNEELSRVLNARLKDVPQFRIVLKGFSKQSGPAGNWLCLDVLSGAGQIRNIHDILYANEFKPFDIGFEYCPHMTVGKFETEQELDDAYSTVMKMRDSFSCKIEKISVEMIGEHEESIIILEKNLRLSAPSAKSDFPRAAFGVKKSTGKDKAPASLADAKACFVEGRYNEARDILLRTGSSDFGPEADLLALLCSYRVRDTETLLNKVSSSAQAVKILFSRPELKILAEDLEAAENGMAAHMAEYCILNLMIHGLTSMDMDILFNKTTGPSEKRPSAFSQMDQEDAQNFRRNQAIENAREPYEFDIFEEIDDIRVKFKSAVTDPDRDLGSVSSAGLNLVADIFTLASRADDYYNPYQYRDGVYISRPEVREHDYGVNKAPKKRIERMENDGDFSGNRSKERSSRGLVFDLLTKIENYYPAQEDKIKYRDALMEQIKYEEGQILS